MNNLLLLAAEDTSMWTSIIMMGAVLLVFYFVMIRPQNKKEKEQQKMRNELNIGDEVISIGGIVGRVISIKEDTILVESGTDRVKIRLKKWAVQEVNKLELE